MSSNRVFLMSIRPKYAEAIFSGKKKYELRRLRGPRIPPRSTVIVYSSGDTRSIVGEFTVHRVIEDSPPSIWNRVSYPGSGISRDAYNYIRGAKKALALEVMNPILYRRPVSLDEVRNIIPGWNPPMSYIELYEDDPLYRLIVEKIRRL
ncbi:MAG: ASCH domain-containing protein [Desulfurococcales archaeon]|nr:ASCH domain-containing protein [Desulfurococcales archaeon]